MPQTLLDKLKIGETLPKHDAFDLLVLQWDFWELSYRGGASYKNGRDGTGEEVFIKHELETDTSMKGRKRHATYRNYVKTVIRKYNSWIFTSPVKRDDKDPAWSEFQKNADNLGTPLHMFMQEAERWAQVFGRYYVVMESTKTDPMLTEAQAVDAQERLFAIAAHPKRVFNWIEKSDVLIEALVTFPEERQARLYTKDVIILITLDAKEDAIRAIEPTPNAFGILPVVRLQAMSDGTSQAGDIAEVNKSLFNLDALHREELSKQTFTQYFGLGMDCDDLKGAVAPGGRKVICINKPDVKFDRISADPSQAQSIREAMQDDIKEIWRLAGLRDPDIMQQAESGRALKIQQSEVALTTADIADNAEKGENQLIRLFEAGMGAKENTIEDSDYPEQFDIEDLAEELKATLETLDSELPPVLKESQVRQYAAKKFPKMDDDAKQDMNEQLEKQFAEDEEQKMQGVVLRMQPSATSEGIEPATGTAQ